MTPTRRRLALGLLVALVGSAVVVLHDAPARATLLGSGTGFGGRQAAAPQSLSTSSLTAQGTFEISGSAVGLYPGLTTPLTLTVENPQHFAIVVTSLTVAVGNASGSCTGGYLSVTPFSGTVTVDARAAVTVTLHVTLAHQAPDACQGATFPLRYAGQAVKG